MVDLPDRADLAHGCGKDACQVLFEGLWLLSTLVVELDYSSERRFA